MNRDEALKLLKELNLACDGVGEQGIMLMPPDADNVLSHGYQLHIKATGIERLDCIKSLVEKYKLALANEQEKQLLVIYRPIQKDRGF